MSKSSRKATNLLIGLSRTRTAFKVSIGGDHYFIDVEQYDSDSTILYFTPVESDFKELL